MLLNLIQNVDAAAQAAEAAANGAEQQPSNPFMNYFLLIIFLVVIIWMMFIQPRKQQKKRQAELNKLEKGSRVITNSGIYGRIRDVKEKAFVIEIADGVKITVDKSCVYPLNESEEAPQQK